MAKGVKGSTPPGEEKPVKTSFIIEPSIMKQVRYVALVQEIDITKIVKDALTEYLAKYEKKHGPIPVK